MTATTNANFDQHTEALEVAAAFAGDITSKSVLITGVNRQGIGFTTAQAFASQAPSMLIVSGRNLTKVQESIDALKTEYPSVNIRALKLDLSSQKAVRAAAEELLGWDDLPALDILVNNAAVMNVPERTLTDDGVEIQFATNHLGHFLFTSLIMPKMLTAARKNPKGATRIVNVTSLSPTLATMRWDDTNFETMNKDLPQDQQPNYAMHRHWGITDAENQKYLPLEGYNQSKVANVLFSVAINERLYEKYGVLSFAVHPGIIFTELSRYAPPHMIAANREFLKNYNTHIKSLEAGAATTMVAATDPRLTKPESELRDGKENHGVYLINCQISDKALAGSVSSKNAQRLWNLSENLVGEKFGW